MTFVRSQQAGTAWHSMAWLEIFHASFGLDAVILMDNSSVDTLDVLSGSDLCRTDRSHGAMRELFSSKTGAPEPRSACFASCLFFKNIPIMV